MRSAAKQYSELKRDRAKTAVKLYNSFLKDYIFLFEKDRRKTADNLQTFFGKDKIKVAAVDGTKYLKSRRGCLVFYVLAAPLTYELDLTSANLRPVRIEEETTKYNVMALVPVPLSEIFLIGEEHSSEGEDEEGAGEELEIGDVFTPQKIGKIDNVLMKLAEVYSISSLLITTKPDVIIADGSLFQDYSFSNRSADKLSMYRGEVLGQRTRKGDFMLFKSFPISSGLQIPSESFTREFLTAEIINSGQIELKKRNGRYFFKSVLTKKESSISGRQLENLEAIEYLSVKKNETVTLQLKDDYKNAWERLKKLFLSVCEEGYRKNNLDAFRIYSQEDGKKTYRYLCEEDVETLCRIGYNMIIEECWKTNTLLFSVTKDSYVRFFVDNFLTIAGPRHLNVFNLDQELLPRVPSTDSGMMYDISIRIDKLHPPISLMEYDPAVSTVFSLREENTSTYAVAQLRKVAQERQFMRMLVQLSEDTSGRKSYVYTVDRITYPQFDKDFKTMVVKLGDKDFKFAYYDKPHDLMKTIVGLMYLLSSNRHDAVFGYPDPLFDVDQYVKTLGRSHLETLDLALTEIDLDEFSVTYREMRERGGG